MRGQAACPHSVSNFSEALVERWSPRWCGQAAPNLGVALGACAARGVRLRAQAWICS